MVRQAHHDGLSKGLCLCERQSMSIIEVCYYFDMSQAMMPLGRFEGV